ncbi:hypothetical protein NEOKW01_0055 [Nematocida sp. AWRm80]|nr:hypothetical protein NEOKW01_0055 [Nematocida sp. AWRm80]
MDRKNTIETIENQLVSEKTWFEKGEVTISDRPKNSLLFKQEKRKTAKKEEEEESDDSEDLAENLEFKRSKTVLKIDAQQQKEIEKIIKQKIKDKSYDNPRKPKPVSQKDKLSEMYESMPTVKETQAPEDRPALHDIYEGRRTENDKFMDKNKMIALFNEIDHDLANLSDSLYIISRPIVPKTTQPTEIKPTAEKPLEH